MGPYWQLEGFVSVKFSQQFFLSIFLFGICKVSLAWKFPTFWFSRPLKTAQAPSAFFAYVQSQIYSWKIVQIPYSFPMIWIGGKKSVCNLLRQYFHCHNAGGVTCENLLHSSQLVSLLFGRTIASCLLSSTVLFWGTNQIHSLSHRWFTAPGFSKHLLFYVGIYTGHLVCIICSRVFNCKAGLINTTSGYFRIMCIFQFFFYELVV